MTPQQGISFKALDNGFASCEHPEQLAAICHSLSATDVHAFFDRWQAALPSPLTDEDRRRGYGHALAFRQLEISDTRMFDRPAADDVGPSGGRLNSTSDKIARNAA